MEIACEFNLQLYHRGATFYTLLWKTRLFISVGVKPIAIFSEANVLNRLLIRFQICISCTFGCQKSVQPNFRFCDHDGHTFHFYGICLNRNCEIYPECQNGTRLRFPFLAVGYFQGRKYSLHPLSLSQ